MAELVYLLCAIASVLCAVLLFRSYRLTRTRLCLWSSICFAGLALNNILLFVDLVLTPTFDLSLLRSGIALIAMVTLLWGLIWEHR